MQQRHIEAVLFSVKAAVSALVAALVYTHLGFPGAPWAAAVSAVIVSQPSLHASLKSSLWRVLANLAGAFGSATLLCLIGQPLAAMFLGVLLTGLTCYLLKQDDALRPAFVAVVIITLSGEQAGWQTSVHRVEAVVIGCLCALVLGFLFDRITNQIPSLQTKGDTNNE